MGNSVVSADMPLSHFWPKCSYDVLPLYARIVLLFSYLVMIRFISLSVVHTHEMGNVIIPAFRDVRNTRFLCKNKTHSRFILKRKNVFFISTKGLGFLFGLFYFNKLWVTIYSLWANQNEALAFLKAWLVPIRNTL